MTQNYKKATISKTLRNAVWNDNIGDNFAKGQCYVGCGIEISMQNYECGHIQSEKNGGKTEVTNLKPICSSCNKSMGIKNMIDFSKDTGFYENSGFHKEDSDDEDENKWMKDTKYEEIIEAFIMGDKYRDSNDLLKYASKAGRLDVCKYAVDIKNADVTYQNNSPTLLAIREGHLDVVKYLDLKGGNTSFSKCKAIRQTVLNNNLIMIKFLMEEAKHKNKNIANLDSYIETAKRKKYNDMIVYLRGLKIALNID